MPHADSSLVPEEIKTKEQFYEHVHEQLRALLSDSTYWVSNLAQTSSLLYHSYAGTSLYGLNGTSPVVNWVGFYLQQNGEGDLIVGPYQGRPACAVIKAKAGRGVCADAFVGNKGVVVPNVDEYPGHIACDGDTKSEVVLPLRLKVADGDKTVGVLDLDSTVLATFDEVDLDGLQTVVDILRETSHWA